MVAALLPATTLNPKYQPLYLELTLDPAIGRVCAVVLGNRAAVDYRRPGVTSVGSVSFVTPLHVG